MTRHHIGAWMGAVVLIGMADQSFAQSLWGNSYGYRDYTVDLTLARAALMVIGVPPLKWSTNWDSMIPFQEAMMS